MKNKSNNFAYIDGANLHKGVESSGWSLDYRRFDKAVIVTSDGDYASLVKFLQSRQNLFAILSAHPKDKCSILLKRTDARISYINDQRSNLELTQKEKAPDKNRIL